MIGAAAADSALDPSPAWSTTKLPGTIGDAVAVADKAPAIAAKANDVTRIRSPVRSFPSACPDYRRKRATGPTQVARVCLPCDALLLHPFILFEVLEAGIPRE